MKGIFISLVFHFLTLQTLNAQKAASLKPKLIVGLVVDQMRWDYLYKYSRYGNEGFNRLLREGYSCENTFINYVPTYTAPGHASIFTGSVPAMNGIVGNSWYSKSLGRTVYCTEDENVTTVGSHSNAGKMSPKNLWSSTFPDELRLASNFKNKTIAIALKDRGSILPGGHTANAAYWFDNATGGWITSSFYMNDLPAWLKAFNNKKLPDVYLKQNWTPLYPLNTYASDSDKNDYERNLPGGSNVFPHTTEAIKDNKYETFRYIPAGNTYTIDMAKAAIENENLGKRGFTDMLSISLSSPDYAGHAFGPNSKEIEDMYLRLDKDLGNFLNYLDREIGKGEYLLFLTADHGVAHIPGFAEAHKIPSGVETDAKLLVLLNDSISKSLQVHNAVSYIINSQIYLSGKAVNEENKTIIKEEIKRLLINHPAISHAFDLQSLPSLLLPQPLRMVVENGYNHQRSGDIQFVYKPQWFSGWKTGTSHGSWNPYDSHIPLLWYGWNIKQGKLYRDVYMTDIAVTIAAMLQIQMPNAATGKVISELLNND